MKPQYLSICLLVLLFLGTGGRSFAQYSFTTIDDPSANDGTVVTGISGNTIAGYYFASNGANSSEYGFLYDGSNYTTLEDPLGIAGSTEVDGISGTNVVGYYISSSDNLQHGFLYSGGTYTTIDDPLALGGHNYAQGISGNNIAGYYSGSSGGVSGFLYNGNSFTTLTVPGAAGTTPLGISGNNVVGFYGDTDDLVQHGFLYNGSTYLTLDDPLASPEGVPYSGTIATGISGNNIVGDYYEPNTISHGFLFNGSTYTTIDVPLSTETTILGIDGNNIVGSYYSDGMLHGFEATLTPEPSTVALLGLGLCTLAWATRCRFPSGHPELVEGSASGKSALNRTECLPSGS